MKEYETCDDLVKELRVKNIACSFVDIAVVLSISLAVSAFVPAIVLPIGITIVAKKIINDL